jgi:predicted nucleic acid-binding protein
MIFLDTSAVYALADAGDPHHDQARDRMRALLDAREALLTHNYVLLESIALVQHRMGLSAAASVARGMQLFDVEWVDRATHEEALSRLVQSGRSEVSLVDQVSFLVMQRRGLVSALAFDQDFLDAGFRLYGT